MQVDLKQFGKYELHHEIEIAIATGDVACIKKHIDAGWRVNQMLELGEGVKISPVVLAIINNDYKTLDFLVENNANLDFRNSHAFLYAVRCCDKEMVRYIASLGAKIEVKYSAGVGAYELACEYSDENKLEMFQLIDSLGLSIKDNAGQALIMQVNEDIEVLEYLLENGVDVNVKDSIFPMGKMTPILYAIMHGNLEAVKLLAEYGADLTVTSSIGTPYAVAVQQGQTEIADFIMQALNNKIDVATNNKVDEIKELLALGKLIPFKRKEESMSVACLGRKLILTV